MKNKLSKIFCFGLLAAAFSHYAAAATDTAAILQITGAVIDSQNDDCHIDFGNMTSVNLDTRLDKMMPEGVYNGAQATPILIYVRGDNPEGTCTQRINNHQIALKFTGIPDSANGQTLGNTLSDENAAQGIGVELFHDNKSVPVNSQLPLTNIGSTGNMRIDLQMVKLDGQSPAGGQIQSNLTVEVVRL
ncbi:hypothetical protein AGJ35_07900 [Cronobacter dublinensis subsp. dublinensis]|nr:hypothetical protein [Cronobacter dublinensis subsp. dublinensis]EGT5735326.1 hypothetical protein [Cronobacter dublinensis subsp. dublinensis]